MFVWRVAVEVDVVDILEDTPQNVWLPTSKNAGISRQFFDKYYNGDEIAVAYVLGAIKRIKNHSLPQNLELAPHRNPLFILEKKAVKS